MKMEVCWIRAGPVLDRCRTWIGRHKFNIIFGKLYLEKSRTSFGTEVTYATIRWSLIKSIDLDIQTDESDIQLKYDVTKIVLKIHLYFRLVQVSEAEKLEGKSPTDYWRYLQTRWPRSYEQTKWKARNRLAIGHVKTEMNVNHARKFVRCGKKTASRHCNMPKEKRQFGRCWIKRT